MRNVHWQAAVSAVCAVACAACQTQGSATTATQAQAPATTATQAQAKPTPDNVPPPSFEYPQKRMIEGHGLVVHAPQIRSWPDFERFEAWVALEFTPSGESTPRYVTASLSGRTQVDLDKRLVHVNEPRIDQVLFAVEAPAEYTEVIKRAIIRERLDVPLDLFLSALAEGVLETKSAAGFNTKPPPIHVKEKPTILLYINGQLALQPLETTGLQILVNANWPTFKNPTDGSHYLLAHDLWLKASKLDGPWKVTKKLPEAFNRIAVDGPNAQIRSAVPPKETKQPVPAVLVSREPAELVVTEGKPQLAEIPETAGLQYVTNTVSPLFKLGNDWYFLASGRWFKTQQLAKGPWAFVEKLPDAFAKIPADHAIAQVRASVPGTPEARMAVLEAMLPTKNAVAREADAPIRVTYIGNPQFENIAGTTVSRATNTNFDVLLIQGKYYLCYAGAWYVSSSPTGPWMVATSVPSAVYTIPPSSPSYHVTQVVIVETTTTEVVYSYPPSYDSNVWVSFGMVWYGTGWYYPPYYGGGYWYPYYPSYGGGSWYNPSTGRFGSRSTYYGPYGGYSYNQSYNPRTGRYGSVETAWDGNQWASSGQTYNPRTGVSTETERYYNENTGRMETERTAQRGDQSVSTERTRDYNDGTSTVNRETSRGGSQQSQRQQQGGTTTGSSTIETGGGRTIQTEGEFSGGQGTITGSGSGGSSGTIDVSREPGGGTTRQGEITTGSGETISSSTQREGTKTRTDIETSGGGQAVSVSEGAGRTTVAQSGSGDLYAGHNGNVYKKADNGWQHYENGGWQQAERPAASPTPQERSSTRSSSTTSSRDYSRDSSQLNQDYSARQRGQSSFQQRGGGMRGGGRRR
jgi:hypothetical protein